MADAKEADIKAVSSLAPWHDDLLNRREYADFLTAYLSRRVCPESGPNASFTLALDAQWGQGKTYFIQNWARTLQESTDSHPAFVFDAWAADYAADPVVAFMAAFRSAIDAEISRGGLKPSLQKKAKRNIGNAVRFLRRGLIPAGKQVAKGVLTKVTGVAAGEVVEAFRDGSAEIDMDQLTEAGLDGVNAGLDAYFEKELEAHSEKAQVFRDFRESVEETLRVISEASDRKLPLFAFVDELDRCRPDFAISLLEGLKHVFGIKGVCFVVSTNVSQLTEAVKAVYGSGFNGYSYLKRFFDVSYALPDFNGDTFIDDLVRHHLVLPVAVDLGLPLRGSGSVEKKSPVATLKWIFDAFELDLRSQRQVCEMISAAAAGVPGSKTIFLLWLAFLCALRHVDSAGFDAIAIKGDVAADFQGVVKARIKRDQGTTFFAERSGMEFRYDPKTPRTVSLWDVVSKYYVWSWADLKDISRIASDSNAYDYPQSLASKLAEELPNPHNPDESYSPSIRSYYRLVRCAGQLTLG